MLDSAPSPIQAKTLDIEQDRSLETANQVTRAIYDAIQNLRPMPHRGRPGRIESTRELVLSSLPYIVVYRVFDERLLILNIVHGDGRRPLGGTPLTGYAARQFGKAVK